VQAALGKKKRQPASPYEPLQASLDQLEERAASIQKRLAEMGPQLKTELARVSALRGWQVHQAEGIEGALDYIGNVASSTNSTLAVRSGQDIFQQLPVDAALSNVGLDVQVMGNGLETSSEGLQEAAATAGLGITGVDYAVAETGSVVLLPRQGLSRLVSLLPPVHIAIVRTEEIVETLDDVFALRRLAYHRGNGDMGSYLNFITGPSRTADIEQTLVIGVHGPREVHLVLLP